MIETRPLVAVDQINLATYRHEANLHQHQVATLMGVSSSKVSRMEAGEIHPNATDIALYLAACGHTAIVTIQPGATP